MLILGLAAQMARYDMAVKHVHELLLQSVAVTPRNVINLAAFAPV